MTDAAAAAPRPGDNQPPDPAVMLAENLAERNRDLIKRRDEILAAAAGWPDVEITSDEDGQKLTDMVGRGGTTAKFRAEVERKQAIEAAPWLNGHRTVLGWFKVQAMDKVTAQETRLRGLLTRFLDRKAVAEQERRRAEAAEARRKADEARREAEAEEKRKADEARKIAEAEAAALRKAELMRNPMVDRASPPPPPRPAPPPPAPPKKTEADKLHTEAAAAEREADKAERAANAKPAELSRTRGERGAVASLRRVWHGEIADREEMTVGTWRALAPFISLDTLNAAADKYAKTNGGEGRPDPELPGCKFYQATTL